VRRLHHPSDYATKLLQMSARMCRARWFDLTRFGWRRIERDCRAAAGGQPSRASVQRSSIERSAISPSRIGRVRGPVFDDAVTLQHFSKVLVCILSISSRRRPDNARAITPALPSSNLTRFARQFLVSGLSHIVDSLTILMLTATTSFKQASGTVTRCRASDCCRKRRPV
jgi:hypothetical protein